MNINLFKIICGAFAAITLVACGGGGGGGSPAASTPAPTTAQSCASTLTTSSTVLCINQVTVDGNPYPSDHYQAASATLTASGFSDLVLSPNSISNADNTVAVNDIALSFLKGTGNPLAFTSWSPTISGGDGKANAFYARDIVFGNFDGTGHTSMYIADESEMCAAGQTPPCNFSGTTQYAYINDGNGNFTKVNTGIGPASVHGPSVGNLTTDKFSILFNNPWVPANQNVLDEGYNLTVPQTVGLTTSSTALAGARCFYTAAVILNNVKSSTGKRDVICFSPEPVRDNHIIMYNDGNGNFNTVATDVLPNASGFVGWTVESVAVGNFSGHTDGREDFAVLQVNRTTVGTNGNTAIHIYITNAQGVPVESTAAYFGNTACSSCLTDFANDASGFMRLIAVDVNGDGKTDIAFMRTNTAAVGVARQLELLLSQGTYFARKTFHPATNGWFGPTVIARKLTSGQAQLLFSVNSNLAAVTVQ